MKLPAIKIAACGLQNNAIAAGAADLTAEIGDDQSLDRARPGRDDEPVGTDAGGCAVDLDVEHGIIPEPGAIGIGRRSRLTEAVHDHGTGDRRQRREVRAMS